MHIREGDRYQFDRVRPEGDQIVGAAVESPYTTGRTERTEGDRMELNELSEVIERKLTYPIDIATVREELGETEVSAPDAEDNKTIAELLDNVEEGTYNSSTDLFETLLTRLPDQYIGRKYYDDRGSTVPDTDSSNRNEADQSF
jgi:hypothetical protein